MGWRRAALTNLVWMTVGVAVIASALAQMAEPDAAQPTLGTYKGTGRACSGTLTIGTKSNSAGWTTHWPATSGAKSAR
jgi:hypothetical protein